MNLTELLEARRQGRATITADEAWPALGVSRSSFYRGMAAGEVPGVLKLGRKRLLALGPFLRWIGADVGDEGGLHHVQVDALHDDEQVEP